MGHKRFRDGRKNVEHDERPGRPSASTTNGNVEKLKVIVTNDRRIRKLADDVGVSIGSGREIVSDVLGIETRGRKVCSKIVEFGKKQRSMEIAQGLLN